MMRLIARFYAFAFSVTLKKRSNDQCPSTPTSGLWSFGLNIHAFVRVSSLQWVEHNEEMEK